MDALDLPGTYASRLAAPRRLLLVLVAEIGDVTRFPNAAALCRPSVGSIAIRSPTRGMG